MARFYDPNAYVEGTPYRRTSSGRGIAFLIAVSLLLSLPGSLRAMTIEYQEAKTVPLYKAFGTKEQWHATAYDIKDEDKVYEFCGMHPDECKDDESGEYPAMKLCFWYDPSRKDQDCHRVDDAIAGIKPGKNVHFHSYDSTGRLRVVRLCDMCSNRYGLEFDAEDTGYAVSYLNMLSIWVYDRKAGKFVNIIPKAWFLEQGDYRVIPRLDGTEGIVVVADAILDYMKETRYGFHRFLISIYRMGKDGRYEDIGYYETKKKWFIRLKRTSSHEAP